MAGGLLFSVDVDSGGQDVALKQVDQPEQTDVRLPEHFQAIRRRRTQNIPLGWL